MCFMMKRRGLRRSLRGSKRQSGTLSLPTTPPDCKKKERKRENASKEWALKNWTRRGRRKNDRQPEKRRKEHRRRNGSDRRLRKKRQRSYAITGKCWPERKSKRKNKGRKRLNYKNR